MRLNDKTFRYGILDWDFKMWVWAIPVLNKILKICFETLTFVLRAVPVYVQLLIVYFVLPDLFSFNLSPFVASVIALGLCSGGYVSQIVRCGINSIPKEQWEAQNLLLRRHVPAVLADIA